MLADELLLAGTSRKQKKDVLSIHTHPEENTYDGHRCKAVAQAKRTASSGNEANTML